MQQPLTSRVVDLFLELCAIPSPPGEERAVADRVTRELDRIGLPWVEDASGPGIGSTAGNVVCRLPGRSDGGVPIFLCAHFDTVPLEGALEPVLGEDGVVRNTGGTILGADNKSALAVMVEAARRIVAEGLPHAGVELLFTPMEEIGLVGATAFDVESLEAEVGYVYDQAAPIGEVVAAIRREKPAVVFAPHVETSAGMVLPDDYLKAVADAAHEVGGLFVLDCIASGALWVDMKATGVDVLVSAPQKGWTGSPCCAGAMAAVAPRATATATERNHLRCLIARPPVHR